MGVVIDEFIAEVEPSSGNNQPQADDSEDRPVTPSVDELKLCQKLQLLKERKLRLKAD